MNFNGNLQGEKTFKFQNWFTSLFANRITEQWKVRLSANQSYNQSDFTVTVFDTAGNPSGEETITNISRSYGADALVVRSVGARWSAGARVSAVHSTYLNQDLSVHIAPALEYDVFPYSQSTRRLLTLRYDIGVTSFQYHDTTIYNRIAETRFTESLSLSLDVKQPWGSADFRVYKGLSFRFFGDVDLIHDQLFLAKGGASEQEVLLRRRQFETSYRYFAFFGLNYTFGSKFANVVNPRFEGGSGGFFSF